MKIHDPSDESAIVMDLMLYSKALVREPIPEWWGWLARELEAELLKSIKRDERP